MKSSCFLNGDLFLLEVDNEHNAGELLHIFDTAEVSLELIAFSLKLCNFLLWKEFELADSFHLIDLVESLYSRTNSLEVGKSTAEPSLVHKVHTASRSLFLDRFLSLFFRSDEENALAACRNLSDESVRFLYEIDADLKVDDVDVVSCRIDVLAHLRIPSLGLVTEVNACL